MDDNHHEDKLSSRPLKNAWHLRSLVFDLEEPDLHTHSARYLIDFGIKKAQKDNIEVTAYEKSIFGLMEKMGFHMHLYMLHHVHLQDGTTKRLHFRSMRWVPPSLASDEIEIA